MGKFTVENKLIRRVLTGWNGQRFLFLGIGFVYLVSSIIDFSFIGVLFSLLIVFQGIFGFGCAGGNCSI